MAVVLGCMNICVDRSIGTGDDALCKQTGTFAVKGGDELDVYYPAPYASPPNVTFKCMFNEYDFVPVGQYPDHFRVKNTGHFGGEVTWEAKGVRQAPAVATPLGTAPALPSAPVPGAGQ
jgi:hypothetical protein